MRAPSRTHAARDPRALESLSHAQMVDRRMPYPPILAWLLATRVLTVADLRTVGWPDNPRRTTHDHGIAQALRTQLIEPVDAHGTVFQLGRRGAALLHAAGVARARYRPAPAPRTVGGLVLFSQLAVALATELRTYPGCTALDVRAAAFSGDLVRPDGTIILHWAATADALSPHHRPALYPAPIGDPADTCLLAVEIDSGTEYTDALAQRVQRWHTYRHFPGTSALALPARVLWVTTGGPRRLATLQTVWQTGTTLPALFITRNGLQADTPGSLRPLTAIWYDATRRAVPGLAAFAAPTSTGAH